MLCSPLNVCCSCFRMTCLAAICLTQAWMMWKFINFQLKKWREHSQNQASKKKTVSPKSKPHKRDLTRGECSGTSASAQPQTSCNPACYFLSHAVSDSVLLIVEPFHVKSLSLVSSGGATNGIVKSDDKTSPRARKAKAT